MQRPENLLKISLWFVTVVVAGSLLPPMWPIAQAKAERTLNIEKRHQYLEGMCIPCKPAHVPHFSIHLKP